MSLLEPQSLIYFPPEAKPSKEFHLHYVVSDDCNVELMPKEIVPHAAIASEVFSCDVLFAGGRPTVGIPVNEPSIE